MSTNTRRNPTVPPTTAPAITEILNVIMGPSSVLVVIIDVAGADSERINRHYDGVIILNG